MPTPPNFRRTKREGTNSTAIRGYKCTCHPATSIYAGWAGSRKPAAGTRLEGPPPAAQRVNGAEGLRSSFPKYPQPMLDIFFSLLSCFFVLFLSHFQLIGPAHCRATLPIAIYFSKPLLPLILLSTASSKLILPLVGALPSSLRAAHASFFARSPSSASIPLRFESSFFQ